MKTFFFIITIVFFSLEVSSQSKKNTEYKTLLGSDIEHGGYGAFYVGFTKIGSNNAFTGGMKGAWIINHNIGVGIAGSGFMTNRLESHFANENNAFIAGGYGGFLIEPIFYPYNSVHFSVPLIIGGGGVSYIRESMWEYPSDGFFPDVYDGFFVFEPGIEIEFNMVEFMRLALGISYRITSDVDFKVDIAGNNVDLLGGDNLNQFIVKAVFKFGKF